MILQSKYHLINCINKINTNRGDEKINFRFQYLLEELYKAQPVFCNKFISAAFDSDEEQLINQAYLEEQIELISLTEKQRAKLKTDYQLLKEKAERKRKDTRLESKEFTPLDNYLNAFSYAIGYKGKKGYIKKDLKAYLIMLFTQYPLEAKVLLEWVITGKINPTLKDCTSYIQNL